MASMAMARLGNFQSWTHTMSLQDTQKTFHMLDIELIYTTLFVYYAMFSVHEAYAPD